MSSWSPSSWREKSIQQAPKYADPALLAEVERELGTFPPLVFAGECRELEQHLADVCDGKAFLLQGGDCAESFEEHGPNGIRDFFRIFLQMAVVLTFEARLPVVKVGRIAGQFAKPRSSSEETRGGVTLPSYRGDIINGPEFTAEARNPHPKRQLHAYRQAAATLNFVRALATGGYASLANVHKWMLDFVESSKKWQQVTDRIEESIAFMRACGLDPDRHPEMRVTQFYTSHEALLLGYEQALTRQDSTQADHPWVATSGHMLWIGDRTRHPGQAHAEFCRGILNPIGIKCGPDMKPDELEKLIDLINPKNKKGRITLICRFGADKVQDKLPPLVESVKKQGNHVVWSCDPMHGNTVEMNGRKTRPFDKIMAEIDGFFTVHKKTDTWPGGVHLEMTGKNVTECTGGIGDIRPEELGLNYDTACDPRLNATQALDLSFRLADMLKQSRV